MGVGGGGLQIYQAGQRPVCAKCLLFEWMDGGGGGVGERGGVD